MRAIVLGAGPAGLLHALSLRAHGVVIEGVYDPDVERARSLAELVRGRALPSFEAACESDAEVFAVCGPPPVHAAQAFAVGRTDRVVLLEKPIALNDAELTTLEGKGGVVPVLQWRFGRAIRAVRRAIQWGELGPRPDVAVDLAWRREDAYFRSGRGARATWGCGALLSVGIHAVDAVLFAVGGAVSSAFGALTQREGVEVETGAALVLGTRDGVQITLRLTLDAADDRSRLSFCGGGVTAIVEGTEEDPTASTVSWRAADPAKRARLERLEAAEGGWVHGPLLVPFVGAAIGRVAAGGVEVPTVRAVAPAHRAVFEVYASAARLRPAPASEPAVARDTFQHRIGVKP